MLLHKLALHACIMIVHSDTVIRNCLQILHMMVHYDGALWCFDDIVSIFLSCHYYHGSLGIFGLAVCIKVEYLGLMVQPIPFLWWLCVHFLCTLCVMPLCMEVSVLGRRQEIWYFEIFHLHTCLCFLKVCLCCNYLYLSISYINWLWSLAEII